jgi:hypothetical protein
MVCVLILMALLLSDTLAHTAFYQRAFNPNLLPGAEKTNPGGRLHDVFDGYGNGNHNKNVFVENFGDQDIFVRIQIREFLSIDGVPVEGVIHDVSSWPIYNGERINGSTRRVGTITETIGEYGIRWNLGDLSLDRKVFMPTFNHVRYLGVGYEPNLPTLFQRLDAYSMTEALGRGVCSTKYINGRVPVSADSMIESGSQTGIGSNGEFGSTSSHDGSRDYWAVGDTVTHELITLDEFGVIVMGELRTHVARETLTPEFGGLITMEQWLAMDAPPGNFWVLDTEAVDSNGNYTGFFYWASPLPPGEGTALLMDGIGVTLPDDYWEYIILVKTDFVTRETMGRLNYFSPAGQLLWNFSVNESL